MKKERRKTKDRRTQRIGGLGRGRGRREGREGRGGKKEITNFLREECSKVDEKVQESFGNISSLILYKLFLFSHFCLTPRR